MIVMTAAPRVSMERQKGDLPVEGSGGSIMNEDVLQQMLDTTRTTATRLAEQFRIFEIDTSNGSRGRRQTAERVAGIVLDLIEGTARRAYPASAGGRGRGPVPGRHVYREQDSRAPSCNVRLEGAVH